MDVAQLEQDINAAWEARDTIAADTTGPVCEAMVRPEMLIEVDATAYISGD